MIESPPASGGLFSSINPNVSIFDTKKAPSPLQSSSALFRRALKPQICADARGRGPAFPHGDGSTDEIAAGKII